MSTRTPLFFLHLPKTAGTSLRAYLLEQYSEQATFPKFDYRGVDADDLASLASYDLVIGHFDTRLLRQLGRGRHASALIMREPVSRTVSALRHAIADPNFRPHGVAMDGRTLQDVIRDPEVMARFSNNQTGLLSADGARDADDGPPFTFDSLEPDLERALVNLDRFDVVGLMEQFEDSMLRLAWQCGLYPVKLATRLNVASPATEATLTEADRQIVASYNALDIALYAAALARPRLVPPDRSGVIAALPDHYFPPLDGSDLLLRTPFCGYGFYRPDDIGENREDGNNRALRNRGRPGRWTGPGQLAGMTFRVPDARQCVFYVEYFFVEGFAGSVNFLLDGEPAAVDACKVRGIWYATIRYTPPCAGAHDVELELCTDRVAASGEDVRPRGLVVTGLRAIMPG